MSHGFTGTIGSAASNPGLKRVDRLEFTILVDNSIEWMTKMPPGFGSEIKGHLERGPPVDSERTGIPILDLDEYCCGGCLNAVIRLYYRKHGIDIDFKVPMDSLLLL